MKTCLRSVLIAATTAIVPSALSAFIINVDVSDPSAVVFTATTASAWVNATSDTYDGVALKDFFTGNTDWLDKIATSGGMTVLSEDVMDGARGPILDAAFAGVYAGGWTYDDFAFFEWAYRGDPIYARTDTRAIDGMLIFDLTEFASVLPAPGSFGDIYFGAPDNNFIIGQYSVTAVPEPSAVGALIGFMVLSVAYWRRRRVES